MAVNKLKFAKVVVEDDELSRIALHFWKRVCCLVRNGHDAHICLRDCRVSICWEWIYRILLVKLEMSHGKPPLAC